VQLGSDIWIVHASQKKSKTGIKTPKQEIDLINERLKRLSWLVQNYQSTGKLLLYADVLLVVVLVITLILIKRKIVSDIKRLKELSKWKWLLSSP
jgi:hypothetical protein